MIDKRKKLVPGRIENNSYNFPLFKKLLTVAVLILLFLFFLAINYIWRSNFSDETKTYIISKPSLRLEPPIEPEINKTEINESEFNEIKINETEIQEFEEVQQFFPNTKFNHNLISYRIDPACDSNKRKRMIDAFNTLAGEVLPINFYEVLESPDIEISCSQEDKSAIEKDFFIAGEGGAREIIQTGRYNVITNGTVLLYKTPKNSISCDWPNVEIHELMHVLGFNHSQNRQSLMYETIDNCDQQLDKSIINKLISLYSEKNLPDLYFENITAKRNGKYLDFNITIKNGGVTEARKIGFGVFDEGKFVQTIELSSIDNFSGDLNFGYEVFLQVSNFKLLNIDSKEIKFIIDKEGLIAELDKNNKVVSM